jgi:hypothetical protein
LRRAFVAIVAITGLLLPAAASAGRKRHIHFTSTVVGNSISSTQAVFKLHDSYFGNGAGSQHVEITGVEHNGPHIFAINGTDTEITYYGNATAKSTGTYRIGAADANGVATLTGSGHDVRGTGRARGLRSSYTYSGTINMNTGLFKVTLTGTYTL